ncbi:hypothetical protein EDB87DRAFT_267634 [Lactarius vividus]|nr:hypothetical protein EDB87DRAFT_267634 [Lactarius vividus]
MPFLPRNSYYLRVSSSSVLPFYVYLDNEHVDWMSDRVLNKVVTDLRPKIIPKLRAESDAYMGPGPAPANAKKGTVDVHRGGTYHSRRKFFYSWIHRDTYQFAYFLRQTEPHSVLIKTRNFVLDTAPPPPPSSKTSKPQADEQKRSSFIRKRHGASSSRTKKRVSRRGKAARKNNEGDNQDYSPSESESSDDVLQVDEDGDTEMAEGSDGSAAKRTHGANEATTESIDVKVEEDEQGLAQTATAQKSSHVGDAGTSNEMQDDEEQKPKLALELKYQSFSNFKRCLCVVVEPWPPLRRNVRAPSLTPSAATGQSSGVLAQSESRYQRGKTPLFLPDLDDERATPGPSRSRTLPPVPLFDDPQVDRDIEETEYLDDSTAIMQFSQLLNTTGRATGAIEEDDEFDGAALFADADEAKEL